MVMLRCRVCHTALRHLDAVVAPPASRESRRHGGNVSRLFLTSSGGSGGRRTSTTILVRPASSIIVAFQASACTEHRAGQRRSIAQVHDVARTARTSSFHSPDASAIAEPPSLALRRWKSSMLRLTARYGAEVDPANADKISVATAAAVPEVLETWQQVMTGESDVWFRGGARFYASLLAGVWPKLAHHFLSDLVDVCDGFPQSPKMGAESGAFASGELSDEADTSGELNWRRGLAILKEANLAGVRVAPELFVTLLSKAPPGNSRKISRLVSSRVSREYGVEVTPAAFMIAAVAYWREGVVSGAARHLDAMGAELSSSHTVSLQTWLSEQTKHVYAPSAVRDQPDAYPVVRRWPWWLIVVDIYGRASRWVEAARAFDTFVCESVGSARDSKGLIGRLPLPDEPGGELMTVDGAAATTLLWAPVHPSPLARAVMAYIKLNKADAAARTLFSLRTSLTAGADSNSTDAAASAQHPLHPAVGDGRSELPLGPPDPAWLGHVVRGCARLGRWDLYKVVLSPEICEWIAAGEVMAERDERGRGVGVRGRQLREVLRSLEAFMVGKSEVRRPAREGQAEGALACLELLRHALSEVGCEGGGARVLRGAEGATSARAAGGSAGDGLARASPPRSSVLVEVSQCDGKQESDAPYKYVVSLEGRAAGQQEQLAALTEALRYLPAASAGGGGSPSGGVRSDADYASIAGLLLSQIETLTAHEVLDAVRRAWGPTSLETSTPPAERRRSAAFVLYEVGVASGALSEDTHWTSTSAGVMDLNCGGSGGNRVATLAALNMVLMDMLNKHAYGHEVDRHVHHPHADLVMIAERPADGTLRHTVEGVLWLLRSRFGNALGGPELLGQHLSVGDDASAKRRGRRMRPQTLIDANDVPKSDRRGLVLCIPRRRLQRWLLTEGRGMRERHNGGGELWSPSWAEDGADVDVMPPTLPVSAQEAESIGCDVVDGGLADDTFARSRSDLREPLTDVSSSRAQHMC